MTQKKSELEALIAAGIISEETAQQIAAYWQSQKQTSASRLPIVFSILGGLLVGLGIILVVAHNWDDLSHLSKLIFAFLPVLIGQAAGLYTLLKQPQSRAWREGSSVFLLFAIGACIAMVSQIYHIEGELSAFLYGWIWLALPIMYVMDSAIASLLFWIGISMYAINFSDGLYPRQPAYWYCFFAAVAFPFYWMIRKQRPDSNYERFHNWVIPISLASCLGTLFTGRLMMNWVNYQVFYIVLFIVGYWLLKRENRLLSNGWIMIGLIGTVAIAVMQSFFDYWDYSKDLWPESWASADTFYVLVGLMIVYIGLIVFTGRKDPTIFRHPIPYIGAFSIILHLLGDGFPFTGAVLGNLMVLGLGLYYIWQGTKQDHLLILNF
ncbi:MAG: DUF2157 domain-containing protein, partial [Bacteroidota bacterium]